MQSVGSTTTNDMRRNLMGGGTEPSVYRIQIRRENLTLTLVKRNVGDFTLINDQPIASGKHIVHCQVLPKSGTQEGRGTTYV